MPEPTTTPRPARRRQPRILMLRFGYFLERELMAAFARSRAEVRPLRADRLDGDGPAYIKALTDHIAAFRPDALFSINGLGIDHDGELPAMLARLGIRCVTWFVDSPELFLHGVRGLGDTGIIALACDPDARAKLAPTGLDNVHILPLAADATRFDLDAPVPTALPADAPAPVAFLGTSWEDKLAMALKAYPFPEDVMATYRQAGDALAEAPYASATMDALSDRCPDFAAAIEPLDAQGRRCALHLACWAGNRRYRLDRVRKLGTTNALVAGDDHWPRLLAGHGTFATAPPVGYYTPDLCALYRDSAVNFCCGGVQMPAAVTQRAFDIPAAGGFALSDPRPQLDALFDPNTESATYAAPDDIPQTVQYWLDNREAARAVIQAARTRIRAHHTYDHRAAAILDILEGS